MSKYYTQFYHGQITTGLDGKKSRYCEPHDRIFQLDLDGLCDHPCFHDPLLTPQPTPKITEIPKPQMGFQFATTKNGLFDVYSPENLVVEWYNWWAESDIAPNKLPGGLHTRSAIYLSHRKSDDSQR